MKNVLAALTFAAVLFATPLSHAEESEPPKTQTTWYGWQTLIADAGTLAATYMTGNAFVFAGGYTLGAPIVHWAHGNVGRGFGSLGLRVLAPVVTTLAVRSLDRPEVTTGHENETALGIGILGGALFASLFDAIVFGGAF